MNNNTNNNNIFGGINVQQTDNQNNNQNNQYMNNNINNNINNNLNQIENEVINELNNRNVNTNSNFDKIEAINSDNEKFNKNEVFSIFKSSGTETNKDKRKMLEKSLEVFQQNTLSFIEVTIEILNDQELNKENSTLMLVLVYLKNTIEMKFEKKMIQGKNDIVNTLKILFPIFKMIGIFGTKVDGILSNMLSTIMNTNYICSDSSILSELINSTINDFNNNKSINTFLTSYHLIYSIYNSNINNHIFYSLMPLGKNALDLYTGYTNQLLREIKSVNTPDEIKYLTTVIDMRKNFLEILFLICMKLKKMDKLHSDIKQGFINSYMDYCIDSIVYESQEGSFISFTGNKDIDISINAMKSRAFMWVSMLIQYDGNDEINNTVLIEKSIYLFKLITDTFKYLIKNKMDYLAKMCGISNEFTDNEYNNIIFQCNLFLSRILIREPLVSTMISNIKEFLFEIIIPMLISTEFEYIRMTTEGEQHHSFQIDLLGDYSDKSYKTSLTFLFTKLTDKYDGLSTYLINSICNLIEFIASGELDQLKESLKSAQYNRNNYNLPFNFDFITNNSEVILVDTCFFLFNICCKTFSRSKHLDLIKKLCLKYYREFIPVNPNHQNMNIKLFKICSEEIIKDKVAFFLGLYSESLFLELHFIDKINPVVNLTKGAEEMILNSINLLFSMMLNYNSNQGSSFQSCFSLKSILSIDILKPYYNNCIEHFFDKLLSGVREIELYPYFDLIFDVLSIPPQKLKTSFSFNIENKDNSNVDLLGNTHKKMPFSHGQMIELSKNCVDRVLRELKSQDGSSSAISKCLNILTVICELYVLDETNTENINNNINDPNNSFNVDKNSYNSLLLVSEMQFIIKNITNYLKNPNKINFDIEIIEINYLLQKKSVNFLESSILIFSSIEKVITKHESINKTIYNMLYEILEKGKNYIVENDKKVYVNINNLEDESIRNQEENKLMIEAIIRIISNQLDEYETESSYILSILLLQKIIQVSLYYLININNFLINILFLQTYENLPRTTVLKIIEIGFCQAKESLDFYRQEYDIEQDGNVNNLNIDKLELYKLQVLLNLICTTNLFYIYIFVDYIICNFERCTEYKNFIKIILGCKFVMTKQMRMIIIGHVCLLGHEEFYTNMQEYFFEFLEMTFELLRKQKKEESEKLKFELKREIDCNFLEDEYEKDDDKDYSR